VVVGCLKKRKEEGEVVGKKTKKGSDN